MGGMVLLSSIIIGSVLALSNWLLPGSVLAWFASPSPMMELARLAMLGGLVSLAVVREYYQNTYTRALCAFLAVTLAWAGFYYFLDQTQYVFDSLFILLAGISFAIPAIQQSDEPDGIGRLIEAVLPGAVLAYQSRGQLPVQYLGYRSDIVDPSHRLVLASRPSH
jgi:hypothetical protein